MTDYSPKYLSQVAANFASLNQRLKEQAERFKHLQDGKLYLLHSAEGDPGYSDEILVGWWNDGWGCFVCRTQAGDSRGGNRSFAVAIPGGFLRVIGEPPSPAEWTF